jgi:S1-C subfamily serine protease
VAPAGLAALALALGAACSANGGGSSAPAAPTSAPASPAAAAAQATAAAQPTAAAQAERPRELPTPREGVFATADLVKLVEPSVVKVQTPGGVGSGFVIAADGHIITNNHVIATVSGRAAATVTVTMSDGTEYRATVRGADPRADLALLQVEAADLVPLKLARLADVAVGEDVVAIGYALNLAGGEGPSYSVTRGIVSAKNRGIDEGAIGILGSVQTDAAINHGNSGGPLLNMRGEVIGVNTSLAPDQTTGRIAPGIGFAVGSDTVQAVYDALRANGRVDRGLLGIRNFAALRPARARELGIPSDSGGVYLEAEDQISPGGPAAAAGIQPQDVIVQIGDIAIRTEADLAVAMIKHHPGETVPVQVYRGGTKTTLQVTLGTPP